MLEAVVFEEVLAVVVVVEVGKEIDSFVLAAAPS